MFGFKHPHKLITSEGMDMIKRQMECDAHNIHEAAKIANVFDRPFIRFHTEILKEYRQQRYALEKGRFR